MTTGNKFDTKKNRPGKPGPNKDFQFFNISWNYGINIIVGVKLPVFYRPGMVYHILILFG